MPLNRLKPSLSQVAILLLIPATVAVGLVVGGRQAEPGGDPDRSAAHRGSYRPRAKLDTAGFITTLSNIEPWKPTASLGEIARAFQGAVPRCEQRLDLALSRSDRLDTSAVESLIRKASLLHFQGKPRDAYAALEQLRGRLGSDPALADQCLYTVIYYQGVSALRCGETENCVLCQGEGSCILPLSPSATHTNPFGSSRAVQHFSEYLEQFPDDLEVRWLLNLAHMTLSEHPGKVDPRFLLTLDRFERSEFGIGKFRDTSQLAGVDRINISGGAIMDDFDSDGLLDLVVTSSEPTQPMAFYHNKGDGTFENRTGLAKLGDQLGGLYCVQTDYNNDGHTDVFVCRGAWYPIPMRPSLLRNNGNGTFTDVTQEAGLATAVNSISATWADYDNDGSLDLFVCCETQPNRLYRNKGDGTFEDVATAAGVRGTGKHCKGAAWLDFDNDGYPDLFLNYYHGSAQLFRNNRNGTFTDVTIDMGIMGPEHGFSCWAFDYDNDGFLDLFTTTNAHTLKDVVSGLLGRPTVNRPNRLYKNAAGKGFRDVTDEAGLNLSCATMGSNFADFDNDGYLDFYLATGTPDLETLVPNRMFRNLGGARFADITASSGTGHLQKGHAVACGDWSRNGRVDLFVQTGGAVPGDRFHNVLFRNPGQGNNWLNVKLIGQKTNRAAIGARVKVVTAGENPVTVHRHVSSGSSFGANPLELHIGLAKADRVALLEVYWPTSGTTQVFRDVAANQYLEVTELQSDFRRRPTEPAPGPR